VGKGKGTDWPKNGPVASGISAGRGDRVNEGNVTASSVSAPPETKKGKKNYFGFRIIKGPEGEETDEHRVKLRPTLQMHGPIHIACVTRGGGERGANARISGSQGLMPSPNENTGGGKRGSERAKGAYRLPPFGLVEKNSKKKKKRIDHPGCRSSRHASSQLGR